MQNVDDLIETAADLAGRGVSKGGIADELNVSRETASWLVERGTGGKSPAPGSEPHDIHVDWSTVGESSRRIGLVATALADALSTTAEEVAVTVGIEKAGVPLATAVARELDTALATYTPRKQQWDDSDMAELGGSFSQNFGSVEGQHCVVVDDTITSGTTMKETISAIRNRGGDPVCCGVLVDKHGLDKLDRVPVHALIQAIAVEDE